MRASRAGFPFPSSWQSLSQDPDLSYSERAEERRSRIRSLRDDRVGGLRKFSSSRERSERLECDLSQNSPRFTLHRSYAHEVVLAAEGDWRFQGARSRIGVRDDSIGALRDDTRAKNGTDSIYWREEHLAASEGFAFASLLAQASIASRCQFRSAGEECLKEQKI